MSIVAAMLLMGACTWGRQERPPVPTEPESGACSLLSKDQVQAAFGNPVAGVRELSQQDFIVPLPAGFAACAYETGDRYGRLTVSVRPITLHEYEARIASRDPENTREVPGLGEDAAYTVCGELSIYAGGRLLQFGVQYADCAILGPLVSLARVAVPRLGNVAL
jgi:hypothetical protein